MKNQTHCSLFLYTALECEAKPFLKQFDLKKDNSSHPFSVYKNNNIILTVSGVGKVAMAAAVAYTQAKFQNHLLPVLVNIGIAGHKSHSIGDVFLTTKIIDKDSGKQFYPQLIGDKWPKSGEVLTSSVPRTDYNEKHMNDMEASAFYETAVKFSSNELIHSIKVISDNEQSPIKTITPKIVTQWINNNLNQIEDLLSHWVSLQQSITSIELNEFNEIVNQWHFSVSREIKLKALLLRWQTLSATPWFNIHKTGIANSKDALRKLEQDINSLEIHL